MFSSETCQYLFNRGKLASTKSTQRPSYPEDIRCGAFVGGFQRDEGDAVVQRRVAQHAGPENGVFWDVARRVDARENVRETLLDRFGVPVPRQLLRAGLLHFTLRGTEEGERHASSAGPAKHTDHYSSVQ